MINEEPAFSSGQLIVGDTSETGVLRPYDGGVLMYESPFR